MNSDLKHIPNDIKTFAIHTLGCKVNIFESESMANQLKSIGLIEVDFSSSADIYIINTCSVTNVADAKSRNIISRARRNKNAIVIVAGCYSQVASKEIKEKLDVDIIIGNKYKNDICSLLNQFFKNNKDKFIKIDNLLVEKNYEDIIVENYDNRTRAFLKIQDGCNFMCSYCSIPFTRGRQRSADLEKIIDQINQFVSKGFKEIVLTGVNTAGYLDKNNNNFLNLLQTINKLNGDFRVRISSLEPFQINDQIIDIITSNKKRFCSHWHICLQSGCNKTLVDMNRKYSIDEFSNLVKKIREKDNLVSISTDVIAGFPTETEQDFIDSYEFIKKITFSFLHVFPYSRRKNTKANELKNVNDAETIAKRTKRMIELSNKLNKDYMTQFIDKEIEVLFERRENEYLIGKSSQYFDVWFKSDDDSLLNNICKLKCNKMIGHHLVCVKL